MINATTEPNPDETRDVLIVGGGYTGLLLAHALRVFTNLSITVVEARSLFPASTQTEQTEQTEQTDTTQALTKKNPLDLRTSALSRSSAEIFHRLGLWQQLQTQVTPIRTVQVSQQQRFGQATIRAHEENVPALGYVIANADLASCLHTAVQHQPRIQWRTPATVTQVQMHADHAAVQVTTPAGASETIRARLVVAADGDNSPVGRLLGIGMDIHDYQQSALVTTVQTAKQNTEEHTAFERFIQGGSIALLPLSAPADKQYALIWIAATNHARTLSQASDSTFLQSLHQAFGQRLGAFTAVGQRALYPLSLRQAHEQVRSRLVIMGNAAHTLHPLMAQGFNLSVRDVFALTTVLARAQKNSAEENWASLAVLQSYQATRDLDQQKVIRFTDGLLRLFLPSHPGLGALRALGLASFDVLPGAKEWLARQGMGKTGYMDAIV